MLYVSKEKMYKSMSSSQTYTFHVSGMHCHSCELLTEAELSEYPGITAVQASLKNNALTVTGDFGEKTKETVMQDLTVLLEPHGYTLALEKATPQVSWSQFRIALPIALILVLLFVGLQKLGIVNLVDTTTVSYGTIFLVGLIASLSTCMAVVGGLVLSLSATFAKGGSTFRPQALFHIGRLVSFFVLGGTIGALGANVTLSTGATFFLSFIVGLVMLILGINLLDVFHGAKKFQVAMPKVFSKLAYGTVQLEHSFAPFLVGAATFFLPCGFTQSMQLYTLSTGSFLEGALTMFIFALGTLPVLALMSFGSFRIEQSPKRGIFFKTAGIIVILFALFNILNSFVSIGLLPPLFSF
jgi:sulfite exporter TauE/SafE/copper chaperone CopZ